MKIKALATACVASFVAGSAFAADLPARKAPIVAPAPMQSWTSFYFGVNFGFTQGNESGVNVSGGSLFAHPGALANTAPLSSLAAFGSTGRVSTGSSTSFIGGGQVGFNYQISPMMVAGLEADIQASPGDAANWGRLAGSIDLSTVGLPTGNTVTTVTSARKKLDYIGTVRARFGILATPSVLVYATGGLAYGGINANTAIVQTLIGGATGTVNTPYAGYSGASSTRVGYTLGAGAEWKFLANWSAKFEYLYYDLGSVAYSSAMSNIVTPPGGAVPTGAAFYTVGNASRARYNGHIARVGVNYHFNFGAASPVVAAY